MNTNYCVVEYIYINKRKTCGLILYNTLIIKKRMSSVCNKGLCMMSVLFIDNTTSSKKHIDHLFGLISF